MRLAWFRLVFLVFVVCLVPPPTTAQGNPVAQAQSGDATEPAAPDAGGPTGQAEARALLDVLRDETSRAALLAELSRIAGEAAPAEGGDAAAPAATPSDGQQAEPTLGRKLALATQTTLATLAETAVRFRNGLAATQRRLAGLGGERSGALISAAGDLVAVVIATLAAFFVLRMVARRWFARLGAAAVGAGLLRLCAMFTLSVVIDIVVVALAWASGYAIVFFALGQRGAIDINQSLYLNAFLVVELGKVALRAVLSPNAPQLRPMPLSDAGARAWNRRLSVLVSTLGYGLMLVTPLVSQTVSIFTGRAVQVVIYAIVLFWMIALVIRHRHDPARYLATRQDNGEDTTHRILAVFAQFWHWPALAYLFALFVLAVSESGAIEPVLRTSALVVLTVLAGVGVSVLITLGARRGVRLPVSVTETLPLLETRLNAFARSFLSAVRLVILVATVGVAIEVSGLFGLGEGLSRFFGDDFAGALVSVAVIVVATFLLWLALASWVDYRLNPGRGAAAREQTLLTLLRNAATIALILIALMFSLSELGIDIAPLLASAGVLGLAVGFGAQKMVQDIIGGIFIQFENAINVGDVVTVGGVTGTVERLTIRSVSVRDLDGVFHIIPFSSVDMVSNFMRGYGFHVADMGIAYREDIDEAKTLMHQAFDDVKAEAEFGPDMLGPLEWHGLTEFGDNAVILRARIRTRPGKQWGVGRAYNAALKRRFDAAGVEIPFPQTTLWFGEDRQGRAPAARLALRRELARQ
jgi:small-conductance mechanosensitive channel